MTVAYHYSATSRKCNAHLTPVGALQHAGLSAKADVEDENSEEQRKNACQKP